MQIALELTDDVIQDFYAEVPEAKRPSVLAGLIKDYLNRKKSDELLDLPFEPLPSRGVVVTNEMVNRIREEEGI
ncbi:MULTISPECIES: hypothetical protein [unclassified Moraxella]|uniref:hypothetical protein n=1 Tax=unclassified Moraxella TaxID=2685852 RepID=UPI003AF6FFAC